MNELLYSPKIKPDHLARKAIIYLRQSSEKQVRQNLESQRLQYELAERIRSLGWTEIEVIDSDLGRSAGLGSATREGFERVLSAVALGEVGIVASREVSRFVMDPKSWTQKRPFLRWSAALRMKESQCPERVRVTHPA
jgi:hypothetical protein